MTGAERVRALATTLRMAQWAIDEAAFKLPRGELSNAKRGELAGILRDLAILLLATAPEQRAAHRPMPVPETEEWPEETALLGQLRASGWTLWAFGDRERPDALAAVRQDTSVADVIVIRGHDRVAAYRTIVSAGGDPLRADTVTWHHTGTALDVLREITPATPHITSAEPYPIPAECRVPELDRRPITIVPPCGSS